MNPPDPIRGEALTSDELAKIDHYCVEFERWLQAEPRPVSQDALRARLLAMIEPESRGSAVWQRALVELLQVEWAYHQQHGEEISIGLTLGGLEPFLEPLREAYAHWQQSNVATPKFGGTPKFDQQQSSNSDAIHATTASQAEDLANWILRFRNARQADTSLQPTDFLAQNANATPALRDALASLQFIQGCIESPGDQARTIGEFRIIKEIGRGGMGVVFEAEQRSLSRTVALKILYFGAVSDPEAIRRFQREATTVAKLHHTNIVPIFSVGSEGAINYYAMQWIDGESLDRVAKSSKTAIDWERVADWGLQAAEALEHAHCRNVIHRDVKPSNLILDRDGRIWLTDFGLAKRSDDVTLSLAGAMLGTPRYMSPEQASASNHQVDHRSDIYSLGATLFELVTGRPVFEATTPHAILNQILNAAPIPAIQLAPNIPRDLNTILMKCLSKDASERYASAKDLANDLRALLEGRPIRAKRPNWFETTQHWLRKHRKEFGWSVASICATVFCLVVSTASWYGWSRMQEAKLSLTSPNAPLVAEIFRRDGSTAIRPQTVPTQDPFAITPGEYRLKASAPGLLSQDYSLDLEPATTFTKNIRLDSQELRSLDRAFDGSIVRKATGSDFFSYDEQYFSFQNLTSQSSDKYRLHWTSFRNEATTPSFAWPPLGGVKRMDNFDKFDLRPWAYPQRIDWNLDGKEDYLLVMRHQALAALVSSDGVVIWTMGLFSDVTEARPKDAVNWAIDQSHRSTILDVPIRVRDIDGDGVDDFLLHGAAIDAWESSKISQGVELKGERKIVAVSSKTGKVIWETVLEDSLFRLPDPAPYAFRWYAGNHFGGSSLSNGGFTQQLGRWSRVENLDRVRSGNYVPIGSLHTLPSANGERMIYVVGKQYLELNFSTGKPIDLPIPMPATPVVPPRIVELNGNGGPELLLVENLEGKPVPGIPTSANYRDCMRVVAWSFDENRVLWERIISAKWTGISSWWLERPQWPVLDDIDGDGKFEVLVPEDAWIDVDFWNPTGRLSVLSGVDGKPLWKKDIRNADRQVDRFLIVPDVDGDQHRDILVASISGMPVRCFVDCLSGKSGSKIWSSYELIGDGKATTSTYLGQPKLWNSGDDGWPQVVVPMFTSNGELTEGGDFVFLSIGTGKIQHRLSQTHRLEIADVDGDQIEDLLITKLISPKDGMSGGCDKKIIRGVAQEIWQTLGPPRRKVTDLDADHIEDVVACDSTTLAAYSTASGSKLWSCTTGSLSPNFAIHANGIDPAKEPNQKLDDPKLWDFDGDGVMDLLLQHESGGFPDVPLEAISGKTGRKIWKAAEVRRYQKGVARVRVCDLTGDGLPEIVLYGFRDSIVEAQGSRKGFGGDDGHLIVSVFAGRSGALLWRKELSPEYGVGASTGGFNFIFETYPDIEIMDMDGNGKQDLLLSAVVREPDLSQERWDLRALDGRSGQEIWAMPGGRKGNSIRAASIICFPMRSMAAQSQALLTLTPDKFYDPGQPGLSDCKLRCFDAATRSVLWEKEIKLNLYQYRFDGQSNPWRRPHLLERSDGSQWILMGVESPDKLDISILDTNGELRFSSSLATGSSYVSDGIPMAICDCDEDGNEDLLLAIQGIDAYRINDSLEKLFHISNDISPHKQTKSFSIRRQKKRLPATIVVQDWDNSSVEGFLAKTGAKLWHCTGPRRDPKFSITPIDQQMLWDDTQNVAPWVVFNCPDQSNCRLAKRFDDLSLDATKQGVVASSNIKPPNRLLDPRYLRPLPWIESHIDEQLSDHWRQMFKSNGLLSLILIFLPLSYLYYSLTRKSFGMRWWLLLPVIAAFMMSVFNAPQRNGSTWMEQVHLGIISAPEILFAVCIVGWLVRKRWKFVLAVLGAVMLTSVLLGGFSIAQQVHSTAFDHHDRYDYQGWYWIMAYGYGVSSWLFMPTAAVYLGVRFFWKRGSSTTKQEVS